MYIRICEFLHKFDKNQPFNWIKMKAIQTNENRFFFFKSLCKVRSHQMILKYIILLIDNAQKIDFNNGRNQRMAYIAYFPPIYLL